MSIEPPAFPEQPVEPSLSSQKPVFDGSGAAFFRIWIVNLFLTIVTLGIYIPWAKVRTRRYFYHATRLNGRAFDYTASPLKLLLGYVIVAVALISFSLAEFIAIWVPIVLYLIFVCVFPWVRWKSLRFFAANSTYRHLAMHFRGTKSGAYISYLGMPLLAVATLGLLAPWALFKARAYVYGNMRYGDAVSEFRGRVGYFYKACIFPFLGLILLIFLLGTVPIIAGSLMSMGESGQDRTETEPVSEVAEAAEPAVEEEDDFDPKAFEAMLENLPRSAMVMIFFGVAAIYFFMLITFIVIRVLLLNYCWSETHFKTSAGDVSFRSRIHPARYIWILASNVLLTALTLGIFIPFAMVRIHRYRLECLDVIGSERLDSVRGLAPEEVGALGESASDWLDIDFGL